jgi:hypothetical protein
MLLPGFEVEKPGDVDEVAEQGYRTCLPVEGTSEVSVETVMI